MKRTKSRTGIRGRRERLPRKDFLDRKRKLCRGGSEKCHETHSVDTQSAKKRERKKRHQNRSDGRGGEDRGRPDGREKKKSAIILSIKTGKRTSERPRTDGQTADEDYLFRAKKKTRGSNGERKAGGGGGSMPGG